MSFLLFVYSGILDSTYVYIINGLVVIGTILVAKDASKNQSTYTALLTIGSLLFPFIIVLYFDQKWRWKISKAFAFSILFLALLFPFSDLNDFVTLQISKITNNQVFVQFDKMSVNPLLMNLNLENVFVESSSFPSITADELSIRPSISAIMKQLPGGSVKAKGLFKGDLDVSIASIDAGKVEEGAPPKPLKVNLDAEGQNISLKEIKDVFQIKLPFKGQLSFATVATIDTSFIEQPEGEVTLQISKFELPSTTLNTEMMGSVNLPEINLGLIELKGKLNAGKFLIESGKIGQGKDPLSAEIKGDMMLSFTNFGGQIRPIIGAYNLTIDLKVANSYKDNVKFFLNFFDQYKKESADSANYKFAVKAAAMGMPPQFLPAP